MRKRPWFLNHYFILITLFNLGSSIVLQMYNSTISLHIDSQGYEAVLAGTITAIGAITALCYRIFGGSLCGVVGRRRLMLIGFPIFGLASLALSLMESIPLVIALRIVQMLGYAVTTTTISVAVVDIVPKEHMTEGIGYFGLATSLSNAVGPVIALALFNTGYGFRLVMLAGCIAAIVATVFVAFFFNYEKEYAETLRKQTVKKARGIWNFIEKKALPAAIVNFFLTFTTGLITLYLTLFAAREGIAQAGLFFTCSAICVAISRLFAGRLADRFGTLAAVLPGVGLMTIAFVMLAVCPNAHPLYYLAGLLQGLGNGMANPALNAAAVKAADPSRKAIASSTFMLPIDVAFMCSSIFWGAMVDSIPFPVIFTIAASVEIVALLFSLGVFAREKVVNLLKNGKRWKPVSERES